MKRSTAVSLSILFALMLLTATVALLLRPRPVVLAAVPLMGAGAEVCTGTNLLTNPSFEGEYPVYVMPAPGHPDCQTWFADQPNQYCERVKLADEWHPYWLDTPRTENWMNIQPEYVPSLPHEQPPRVRSGDKSQHYFSFWSTHEGGLMQQVSAVANGRYCFSSWGHAWSSRETLSGWLSDPNDHGDLYQRVGIDPTGGTDWQSPNVVWSEMRMQYDEFGLFSVEAVAQADVITVFVWSKANIPVKHNDVYWDDARLTLLESVLVAPGEIASMVDVAVPTAVTHTIGISLTGNLTWTASLDPAGTLSANLNQTNGTTSSNLSLTFDSTGLPAGTYTTTITVDVTPTVPGAPFAIPVTLYVVPDLHQAFLPLLERP
ncbi:MAG: hypothetical protein H6654_16805 [Ardenticatenaceae bacterium]|nr:hypothetical protein [Anaerolineales bacterium]MCB8939694.1 hypothetical protein [Ardenticatenaceae bacterium]MCB8975222.1 hypothetical protein [Ardenticatenaceae bacterium]